MKRLLAIISILLIGAAAWFVFFRPITVIREVTVPYSIWRVGEQVNNLGSIRKWFSPFAGEQNIASADTSAGKLQSGEYALSLENRSVFNSVIRISRNKKSALFAYSALSDSGAVRDSRIQLLYHSTLARKWFGETELIRLAIQNLDNLRDYMTDTKRFYGYEIQEMKVEDTAFLFSRITVPVTEKRMGMVQLFSKLIAFAEKNNAGYNGTRIFYSMLSGKDITLFAGIGVTNAVQTAAVSDVEYKRMPYGKNLLVTSYQGAFGESKKAFEAMELFKTDHQLSSMAIPYQKFLSDGYDFADDQVVQLKIFYPVF